MIEKLAAQLGTSTDINAIRQAVVSQEFSNHPNSRTLILIAQYPFLIIGKIKEVISDYLLIETEITNVSDLDNEMLRVHIDDIEVFYIEEDGVPIPDIRVDRDD